MNAHYAGGVNNDLNSNITMYLAQVYDRFFFAFWKIYAAHLRILWPTYQWKNETFTAW